MIPLQKHTDEREICVFEPPPITKECELTFGASKKGEYETFAVELPHVLFLNDEPASPWTKLLESQSVYNIPKPTIGDTPATSKKRRDLTAAVEALKDDPRVDDRTVATMIGVIQALPRVALGPDIVVSNDGAIEFDWDSETGSGAFTIGALSSGHVIYDWVWGDDRAAGRTKLKDSKLVGFIRCCVNELARKLSYGV